MTGSSPYSDCKLVTITPDCEGHIVYCARVSNPTNQSNSLTAPKLVKYLIRHGHWSPFEMGHMVIEVNTTRAIAAQLLRHKTFAFQEFSQRYADVGQLGSPVIPHLRRQDLKNRQNSIDDLDSEMLAGYYRRIQTLFEDTEHLYREMVSNGVAKECARGILPLNSRSRLYVAGPIRTFLHYISVRRREDTQLEHRVIALEFEEILKKEMPNIWQACSEMEWKFNLK
jgi:thymidylate synthase (FAD)